LVLNATSRLGIVQDVTAQANASGIPVVLVSNSDNPLERIKSLESGADDYLVYPFTPEEVLARTNAILRRYRKSACSSQGVTIGDLTVDLGRMTAFVSGAPIHLTSVEFELLSMLLERKGEVVCKDQIYEAIFERKPSPYVRTLDTHISNLRKKIGSSQDGLPRIRTIRGKGYAFCG
jgi:two-component system, OmpR family, response regulator CpxR